MYGKLRVILTALLMGLMSASKAQTKLSPEQFQAKLSSLKEHSVLMDVRTAEEFTGGHLEDALNIDFNSGEFANNLKGFDKHRPVFVYCLVGGRSAKAAAALVKEGFSQVYDLDGGYLRWTANSLPITGTSNVDSLKKLANGMTRTEFDSLVSVDQPVLVDFTAKWCPPCRVMAPYIEKLAREYEGRAIVKTINYDTNKQLAQDLDIAALPALRIYKNGKEMWSANTFTAEKDLRAALEEQLVP